MTASFVRKLVESYRAVRSIAPQPLFEEVERYALTDLRGRSVGAWEYRFHVHNQTLASSLRLRHAERHPRLSVVALSVGCSTDGYYSFTLTPSPDHAPPPYTLVSYRDRLRVAPLLPRYAAVFTAAIEAVFVREAWATNWRGERLLEKWRQPYPPRAPRDTGVVLHRAVAGERSFEELIRDLDRSLARYVRGGAVKTP